MYDVAHVARWEPPDLRNLPHFFSRRSVSVCVCFYRSDFERDPWSCGRVAAGKTGRKPRTVARTQKIEVCRQYTAKVKGGILALLRLQPCLGEPVSF